MKLSTLNIQLIIVFIVLAKTEQCKFGSGPECIFPCHCNDDAECDADTGECPNGCDDGDPNGYEWRGAYFGPGCQIGNVAYGKETRQAANLVVHDADKAVDGNLDPHVDNGSCSSARSMSIYHGAWWTVNLGDTYAIQRVALYNNDDWGDRRRMRWTIVEVEDENGRKTRCFSLGGSADQANPAVNVSCSEILIGNKVLVRRPAPNAYEPNWITLCEVMVYGYLNRTCEEGYYGPGCLLPCSHCDCGITGCIGECYWGWMNDDCMTREY